MNFSKICSFLIFFIVINGNFLIKALNDVKNNIPTNTLNNELSDSSLFTDELLKSFSVVLKKVPLDLLKEKIKTQIAKAAENLRLPNPEELEPTKKCEINYNELCPENWINLGDGEHCLSPLDYSGPCEKKVSFRNTTALIKNKFASDCDVSWPCMNKCIEDFSKKCPENWKLNKQEICEAPRKYEGKCVKQKSFDNYTIDEKKFWAKECNVKWPCHQKNYDLHFLCPYNWTENPDNKTCLSPNSYVGPCSNILYLYNFSDKEKFDVMKKCNVEWQSRINKTTYDFSAICPIGWKIKNVENETCVAPSSYNGSCKTTVSFINFSKQEKYEFSKKCDVQWSTMDERVQNFNIPCPYNWTLIDKNEHICIAPLEYEGPCQNIMSFKNYTKEMKSAWGSTCKTIFVKGSINVNDGFTKKKIFGLNKNISSDGSLPYLSLNNGAIAKKWIQDKEIINKEEKIGNSDKEIIITDDKITYLYLLKESTDDEELKATIDLTIKELKNKYGNMKYSFIQLNKNNDENIEENIDEIKNLYENYKIENANFSYEDVCIEKDYTKCPLGWTTVNENLCLAPKSYIKTNRKCSSVLNIGNIVKTVYDVSHDMSFVTIDIEARKKLEKDCNLNFPCKECERDYYRITCPLGWKLSKDGLCNAPRTYPKYLREQCGETVDFKYATPLFKKNWSLLCKADWPCYNACEKNYSAICPIGYKLINKREELNGEIVHVCFNENWNKENADNNMCHVIEVFDSVNFKKEIEKKCKVIWPCSDKCEENFYQTCPYNWLLKDNRCIAPYYYNTPKGCKNSFDVLSFNSFDKFIFSNKCFASWPCKNFCQQDWTHNCPNGWREKIITEKNENVKYEKNNEPTENNEKEYMKRIKMNINNMKKKIICIAPKNYEGNCERKQDLTNYTFLQKQDFSFRCNVKWPCGLSIHHNPNWQKINIYTDKNFRKLKTLRFYNTFYLHSYNKIKNSFF